MDSHVLWRNLAWEFRFLFLKFFLYKTEYSELLKETLFLMFSEIHFGSTNLIAFLILYFDSFDLNQGSKLGTIIAQCYSFLVRINDQFCVLSAYT